MANFLILCFLTIARAITIAAPPDMYTDFPLIKLENRKPDYPWQIRPLSNDTLFAKEIVFNRGALKLTSMSGPGEIRLPVFPVFWLQYSLYLAPESSVVRGKGFAPFLSLDFANTTGAEDDIPLLAVAIMDSTGSGPYARFRLRPYADPNSEVVFSPLVQYAKWHCVENRFGFFGADSLEITFFIDNEPAGQARIRYVKNREGILLRLGTHTGRFPFPCDIFLDRLIISKNRQRAFPRAPEPMGPPSDSLHYAPVLRCAPFASLYRGEKPVSTEWRLFRGNDTLPIYATEEGDPTFFFKRPVPFELDSGTYTWQARFRNNFGNTGPFSPLVRFHWPRAKPPLFEIESLFVTKIGKKAPLPAIVPGAWYHLHALLKPGSRPWEELGCFIAWLSGPGFVFGHPGNKGGSFDPARNYILNLAQDSVNGRLIREIYERSDPGGFHFRLLKPGDIGLYVDASQEEVVMDKAQHRIRLKFRLLDSAAAGDWLVSAYTVGPHWDFDSLRRETRSAVFRVPLKVIRPRPYGFGVVTGLCLVISGFLIFLAARARRRTKADAPPSSGLERDFGRIRQYVLDHIREEDINAASIRAALALSSARYYKALKSGNEESLPQLINKIRIARAKELMVGPGKGVSEIGYEVGFSDPRYFGRIFKEMTGQTPTEYREKL